MAETAANDDAAGSGNPGPAGSGLTGQRASQYQNEIYLHGMSGYVPQLPTNLAALDEQAHQRLGAGPYGYIRGAAGDGATDRANVAAFDDWRLLPRMLAGATDRDISTTVLGQSLSAPVALAPIGVQSIAHPQGELASARAAASLGVPFTLSTASSYTIEEVAEASGDGPRWFQLYWPAEDEVAASMLRRAQQAGFTHLVVTLDTWTLGWRPTDLDQAYLPFLRGIGTAIPFSDPAFRAPLDQPPEQALLPAVLRWVSLFTGTDHRWDQLDFLRRHWDGPILLKGILDARDAKEALRAGTDGIVVSNHGGRQVDGAVSALQMLPEIVEAVGSRMEVLFDSGVRGGADVLTALALGARAVLLGRPYAYALALGGQEGVEHALRCLLAEIDLSLGLTGHRTVAELGVDSLRPAR